MRKSYVYDLVLAAMFAVILTICAWITIPFAVPFTMQTFGVFLAIAVLGGKMAAVSIGLYILLGVIGIPVFSGFQSGIGVLFGNTGGYVIGFLVAALVVWGMEVCIEKTSERSTKANAERISGIPVKTIVGRDLKMKTCMLSIRLLVGLFVCYAFGTMWFWLLYMKNSGAISIAAVLGICVVPFVVPDVIKIFLVLAVQKRIKKIVYGMM